MSQESKLEARQYALGDLVEGQTGSEVWTMSAQLLEAFIRLSRDEALAHVDAEHARHMGYEGRLVHGCLVSMPYSRLLGMLLPGSNTVIHQIQVEMVAPVYIGDVLTYEVKVARVFPSVKTVKLGLTAQNHKGILVNRGQATCVFRL